MNEPADPAAGAVDSPGFGGLRVAAFESRRAEEMSRLIVRHGGQACVSPSMREVPIERNPAAAEVAKQLLTGHFDVAIIMTGVGFQHLLAVAERTVDRQRFLASLSDITTIARGPKPTAAMREVGLVPTIRIAEPNTWREILDVIDERLPVTNSRVLLQEYGQTNPSLIAGLEARGAEVTNLRVYQWDLPLDLEPLKNNVLALAAAEREVALFTSAQQVVNVLRVANEWNCADALRRAMRSMVVASIGPTTTEALQLHELPVDLEPDHSKMGQLVAQAAAASQAIRRRKQRIEAVLSGPASDPADQQAPWYNSPFMKACRREPTEVTPVWLMRQAGRYMAEYREIRAKTTFLELCRNPQLCAEVMVTAVRKLGVDAAIIFSDLLPILEPMGMDLEFAKGEGPVIHNPLREARDVDRVKPLESVDSLHFVMETVKQTRIDLPDDIPLIGFAGAPFTLASYMIEGGSSRSYLHTKTLMYRDEGAWRELMRRLAGSITLYLNAQIRAGAQCVQIFDSWAGCLGPSDYRRYVLPYLQEIIGGLQAGVPVINFATGNPALLPMLAQAVPAVVGVDWRMGLGEAWEMIGTDFAVQGNLDPTTLLADRSLLRERVAEVLAQAAGRPGHIFNLGHGVLPQTPVENAQAVVEFVHELSAKR